MIRAILDGKKTMTRRIVKPPRAGKLVYDFSRAIVDRGFPDEKGVYSCPYLKVPYRHRDDEWDKDGDARERICSPYAVTRLWVRETWRSWRWNDAISPSEFVRRWSNDDPRKYVGYVADGDIVRDGLEMDGKTRVSIHMPRWASRITLEVTQVRIERVQEISEEDAIAEGCDGRCPVGNIVTHAKSPSAYQFSQLWDSIHGPGAWDANPWVFAITFKRVEGK